MTEGVFFIEGSTHFDARGTVTFVNDFDLEPVRRFYTITNTDTVLVRGWQGHRFEHKWFHCLRGAFQICVVQPDNWETPSTVLPVFKYVLNANQPTILVVPPGYATAILALEEDALLLVYSDCTLEMAKSDNFRFDISLWNFHV